MATGLKGKGSKAGDVWNGTLGNDVFSAGAGNDQCIAGGGNDRVDCGAGNDRANGGGGNDFVDGGAGGDTIVGGAGNDRLVGGAGGDDISGGAGNDRMAGGAGDDTMDGGSGRDRMFGDAGNDNLNGGSGNDFLNGGDGNDLVSGGTGDDRMIGGAGDDTLDWDDGEGNDVMSGNEGRDTIEVDGSVQLGDNFVLGKNATGNAFFERTGLDGQPIGQFNLVVDSAEIFDVRGDGGNDTFVVNDLAGTGVDLIQFSGGAGNDTLDARATGVRVVADGGEGDDVLTGGTGTIVVSSTSTLGDQMTGGSGRDKFQFLTDAFAGGTPGQNLNRPDVVTDFEFSTDQLVFSQQQLGFNRFNFQKAAVNELKDGNLLILEGKFANAGEASRAIAANDAIKTNKGVFVYYNETLGFSRAVFSQDLANGGPFSVQANLTNLTAAALQSNFTAADFGLA
jgi:Ca2+-binding RTX toxin-like protein